MVNLLNLAVSVDSHVLVFGSSGAGKTTLIRNMLSSFMSDEYSVIVFDPMRLYEEHCDIHAPLPIGLLEVKDRLVDIVIEALISHYRSERYVISPMMEEMLTKIVHSGAKTIDEVLQRLEKIANTSTRQDIVLSATALKRRVSYLSCWIFEKTHRLLRELREGKYRGLVVGLDTSFLNDMQRVVYTLSVIEYTYTSSQGIIYVVDEAHLLLGRSQRALTEYLRLGRNFRKLFILITHSKRDIPETLLDVIRIIVEFPTIRTLGIIPLGTAKIHILSRSRYINNTFIHVDRTLRKRRGKSFRRILEKSRPVLCEGICCIDDLLRRSLVDRKLGSKLLRLIEEISI